MQDQTAHPQIRSLYYAGANSSPAYSAQQSDGTATITVNRVDGTNGAVQVSYATIAGGTATNGTDYTAVSGMLNWPAGDSTPKTFSVPILNNTLAQPNVTVNLALNNPSTGTALGVQSTSVLTIIQPPISAWKLAYFGADANNPAIAGDSADPQNDGIVNLMAYAYASIRWSRTPILLPAVLPATSSC